MSSSSKQGSKLLGVTTRADAEKALLDLANLSGPPDKALPRLFRRNEQVLEALQYHPGEHAYWVTSESPPSLNEWEISIYGVRDHLRKAWTAPDRRSREWHIFQLRRKFSELSKRVSASREELSGKNRVDWLEDTPPVTPLEATMFYFQNTIADRAKHCSGPDCPAPYFIASKRSQKYCSEKCAGPAERESKREWWRNNRRKKGGLQ